MLAAGILWLMKTVAYTTETLHAFLLNEHTQATIMTVLIKQQS